MFSNGQKVGFLFCQFVNRKKIRFAFELSSKTEVGSAGEQPARDKLDVRRKCENKELATWSVL